MQNFVYFQRKQKLTVAQSAQQVHDQLLPFWMKSRLPVRHKPDIVQKIKDLYSQHVELMKNRSRNNAKDQQNQKEYNEKLDILFDISHADSDNLIKNEEDRQFLKLQKESGTGCIGSVDNKMFFRDKRSAKRKERLVLQQRAASAGHQLMQADVETEDEDEETAESSKLSSSDDEESVDEFVVKSPTNDRPTKQPKCAGVMISKVAAVLDRTNISIRKSTIIIALMVNEIGCSTTSVVLSKSTVQKVESALFWRRLSVAICYGWMACRHHMFELLLSDAYGVCLGPSTGPDILIFKRFREKWSELVHRQPMPLPVPLVSASDNLKELIAEQLQLSHPRDD